MSFFKNLKEKAKDVTGLGLNATQQYARAYEKGVLLQKFSDAVKHFETAAEKFDKDGNSAMSKRARANAALYTLVESKSFSAIPAAISALERIEEVEHIGSQHEIVPVAPMLTELQALNREHIAEAASDNNAKVEGFREAATLLMPLGSEPLQFSEYLQLTGPVSKYTSRALYDTGLADYHSAFSAVDASPEDAHDLLQRALASFRAAGADDMAEKTSGYVEDIKSKRHCWMCGREMQGRGLFYQYYPSRVGQYHQRIVETLEQDSGMLDRDKHVTLCTACGSAIEIQADEYATMRAQEVREWAEGEFAVVARHINDLIEDVNNIQARIRSLESAAHKHSD